MKKLILVFLCFSTIVLQAQYSDNDALAYISKYAPLAQASMKIYKIPASITLAQAIYSSNAGLSKVSIESNNHFGILCKSDYSGEKYYETSDRNGDCYRMYATVEQSYQDHGIFISQRPRYAVLFQLPVNDYRAWAQGLQTCGYSVNKEYSQRLIAIIDRFNLTRFDVNLEEESDDEPSTAEPKTTRDFTSESSTANTETTISESTSTNTSTLTTATAASTATKDAPQQDSQQKAVKQPDLVMNGIEIYLEDTPKAPETYNIVSTKPRETDPIVSMNVFTAADLEYRVSYFPYTKRNVYENNKIKFVIAKKGDSYESIAADVQLTASALRSYNDAYDNYQPIEGEVVYLQMKNTKSDISYHRLSSGDSFRYISQKYAIQLKLLLKRNPCPNGGFSEGNTLCIDCK